MLGAPVTGCQTNKQAVSSTWSPDNLVYERLPFKGTRCAPLVALAQTCGQAAASGPAQPSAVHINLPGL
jgi:hypothetical protein